jgi:membrane-associated phospholipid phosphatase
MHIRAQLRGLRRAEQLLVIYLLYCSVIALGWGTRGGSPILMLSINCVAICALLVLPGRDEPWRDWLPFPAILLCYREAGWMGSVVHPSGLEQKWIVWDRLVLNHWHVTAAIEALGAVIPTILEAAYLSVYVLGPIAVGLLYGYRRRGQTDRLWTAFLLGLLLCYVQFPFWPSEPPRTVFPGQNLPSLTTPLRGLNLLLVGNYGIHSSVFPSAHVAGAIGGTLMLRRLLRDRPAVGNAMLAVAVLIAVATVYGRYHYLVDAVAGAAVGVLAYRLASRIPIGPE